MKWKVLDASWWIFPWLKSKGPKQNITASWCNWQQLPTWDASGGCYILLRPLLFGQEKIREFQVQKYTQTLTLCYSLWLYLRWWRYCLKDKMCPAFVLLYSSCFIFHCSVIVSWSWKCDILHFVSSFRWWLAYFVQEQRALNIENFFINADAPIQLSKLTGHWLFELARTSAFFWECITFPSFDEGWVCGLIKNSIGRRKKKNLDI